MPSVSERRTLTDRRVYNNIPFGDIAGIARTTVRNGVTLTLDRVEWQPQPGFHNNMQSVMYNAVAHYSGSYTRNVIPGHITTVTYAGEVVFFDLTPAIIYDLVFVYFPEVYEAEDGYDEYYEDETGYVSADDEYLDGQDYADGQDALGLDADADGLESRGFNVAFLILIPLVLIILALVAVVLHKLGKIRLAFVDKFLGGNNGGDSQYSEDDNEYADGFEDGENNDDDDEEKEDGNSW